MPFGSSRGPKGFSSRWSRRMRPLLPFGWRGAANLGNAGDQHVRTRRQGPLHPRRGDRCADLGGVPGVRVRTARAAGRPWKRHRAPDERADHGSPGGLLPGPRVLHRRCAGPPRRRRRLPRGAVPVLGSTADGPDIQAACAAALAWGFTVDEGFSVLREIAKLSPVPVFVMTYANLAFTRGMRRFLRECKEAGARGVIAPDLPPDYDEGLFDTARTLGLAAVPVLSPSASEDRLRRTELLDPEYVYATLRAGTTGAETRLDDGAVSF